MLIGLMATIFLIPPTREPGRKRMPLTLETLAAEHGHPNNYLEKILKRKPKEVIHNNGAQDEENRGNQGNTIATGRDGLVPGLPDGSGGHELEQIGAAP